MTTTAGTALALPPLAAELAPRTVGRFEALAAAWLLGFAREHTRTAYARDLRSFLAWCQRHELDPLTVRRAHVDLYARQLGEEGRAPSPIARRVSSLSSFYAYAVAEDSLDPNPVAHVRRPQVSRDASPTVGLTRDEARRLLAAAEEDSPRARALVTLLAVNGLRVREELSARVEDLGAERGHRTLRITGKGGHVAVIPLARSTRSRRTWPAGRAARCS